MILIILLALFYLFTFSLAIYLLVNCHQSFLIFKVKDYPFLGHIMKINGILLVILTIIGISMLFLFNIKLNLIPIGIICIIITIFSLHLIKL